MTAYLLRFDDDGADQLAKVGGKAANLASLTRAGFDVPPGYTVTTDAYCLFLDENGLHKTIANALAAIDWSAPAQVDQLTSEIRDAIMAAAVPDAIRRDVEAGYDALGTDVFVAVRSSGTAEDQADASFAGLHDSFLDIRGADQVVDAVKRCWASLWTARATSFRHDRGFDRAEPRIAVVVQAMVESDSSGVMFTGNPVTTATDEIVINSAWGLGEAVVQGIVTPDQYTVDSRGLRIRERVAGAKPVRMVRDHATGNGAVTEAVAPEEQDALSLSDEQAVALAELGRRIELHYGGVPQDIEWAFAGGRLHLLQSRPITGVEFSWDAEVDASMFPWHMTEPGDDVVWTRAFSDAVNTGAVTPLTYTARYEHINTNGWGRAAMLAGLPDLSRLRLFKYHKGTFYYNTDWERQVVERVGIPALRPGMLEWLSPAQREEIVTAPFSYAAYLRFHLAVIAADPRANPYHLPDRLERWRTARPEINGLPADQLRTMSDTEVRDYTEHMLRLEEEYNAEFDVGFYVYFREWMLILAKILQRWYGNEDWQQVLGQLLTGSDEQTDTLKENTALVGFAKRIAGSEVLLQTFREYRDGEFFAQLETTPEGREFLAEYQPWAREYGHRGEADRDMIYPRRCEDPALDYGSFQTFLNMEDLANLDPMAQERETNRRRAEAYESVVTTIGRQPLGRLKAEAFKFTYRVMHRWIVARDNERQSPTDRIMMSFKRGFVEIGRRVHERGHIDEPDGYHYLSKHELYDVLKGHVPHRSLLNMKIAARRRECDRIHHGEAELPMFLRGGRAVDLQAGTAGSDAMRGTGNSPGTVTGVARVVPTLADVVRVRQGEILVTHATDPGWTPVFLLIKGVVVETGGMLSHASCIAREYGFPAVQLPKAQKLIPDGATITVNGTTGQVTIIEEDGDGDLAGGHVGSHPTVDAAATPGS